jgi:hypothetical protein
MNSDSAIAMTPDTRAREEILARGFTRAPLKIDCDIASALAQLAQAAWSMPRDEYYSGGTRFRTLNRFRAEIAAEGVHIEHRGGCEPYVQLKQYNTTLGGQPRNYAALPATLADSCGIRRLMAYHLSYLPLSAVGATYAVNMHVIRFAATPDYPCDTSPPGLHKDGEKYLATHLLARCGAAGGEVRITDNDMRELERFTMHEIGECYVFDDDRIWHMLTPVETAPGSTYAYRDTLAFDLLPDAWQPSLT